MVPTSGYCSFLPDFFILLPLPLVHSTTARGIFLLTPVFKTLWSFFITYILQSVLLHTANSNLHDSDFCFTLHPHSGCVVQVSDFPHRSLAWLFYFSMTLLTILILSRSSSSSIFCIVNFTFIFQPKGHFQNIFSFSTLPSKSFHSILWPHSTL